jgi:hypothetical protein
VLWHHFTGNIILVEEGTQCITNLNSHFTEKSAGLLIGHALADRNPIVHCLITWGFFVSYLYIVNIGELFYRKATVCLVTENADSRKTPVSSRFHNLQRKISNHPKMSWEFHT